MTRTQEYALQDEEVGASLRSVSVPVYGRDATPVAAIDIAVATSRHDVAPLKGPLLKLLHATTAEISLRRGAACRRAGTIRSMR